MIPKDKARQLISDFTSICFNAYIEGGAGLNRPCACQGCEDDLNKRVTVLGKEAALRAANEIYESLPLFVISHNESTYEPEPNKNIEYWREVIDEIEK